jgi:hypothetical protein
MHNWKREEKISQLKILYGEWKEEIQITEVDYKDIIQRWDKHLCDVWNVNRMACPNKYYMLQW